MSGVNKASQGIFEIDGYEFSKDTTVEDVKAMGKFKVYGLNEVYIAKSIPNTVNYFDMDFVSNMYFVNGFLDHFELYPRITDYTKYKSETDAHNACFELCQAILDKCFDETVRKEKSDLGLIVFFDGGFASVIKPSSGRDSTLGGYIFVSFREKEK